MFLGPQMCLPLHFTKFHSCKLRKFFLVYDSPIKKYKPSW